MDYFRKLVGSGQDGATVDTEAGLPPKVQESPPVPIGERRGTIIPSTTDQLTTYRFLVGIISNPSMEKSSAMFRAGTRPASNVGIYTHVVRNEIQSGKTYRFYSILINSCLGLQIVVAAALTALGASNSSSGAVTVFGAINTVIAGFLTFLKGSGLPNRLQYYENEWSKVREFIERHERAFSREDCPLDLYKVVAAIETMYEEVKSDVESTKPDHFISLSSLKKGPTPSALLGPSLMRSDIPEKEIDLKTYLGGKTSEVESGVGNKAEAATTDMQSYWSKGQDAAKALQGYLEKGEGEFTDARTHVNDAVDNQRTQLTQEAERGTSITHDFASLERAQLSQQAEAQARSIQEVGSEQRAQLAQDMDAAADTIERAPGASSSDDIPGAH